MLKVYLDWNVMSGMKNNRFNDFKEIILNRSMFLLVYSTSHISDILSSINGKELAENLPVIEDLEYISFLTDNLCLVNTSDVVELSIRNPKELLENQLEEKTLYDDFSLDALFEQVQSDDALTNSLVTSIKSVLKTLPIDEGLRKSYDNPESAEIMRELFPGLEDDMTMNGFFKSFGRMYQNLNEKDSYKSLREIVQKIGVNSSYFNENKNPFDVINEAYEKHGIKESDVTEHFVNSKNAPKWFNDISSEYLKLDMHGYKSDKVKVTEKGKDTFKNTTDDSFHTAFSSMCEFYITNDDRNYKKSKAVYEKLGILTKVLKPNEFVDYYNQYLNKHTIYEHFNSVLKKMRQTEGFRIQKYQDGGHFGLVHYSNEYYFNFFNKLLVPTESRNNGLPFFILSKENPSETYIISKKEIAGVVKLFVGELGDDIYDNSYFQDVEIVSSDDNWSGRTWDTNIGRFMFTRVNSWFHLYYYLREDS